VKYKRKFHLIFLILTGLFLFSIFILPTASAASSQDIAPTLVEKRITTNPLNSINPVIYGDKIVWQDDRNGNWDIFIFDLTAKKEIFTTNKSDQINPDIYKDKVVWEDYRNGNTDNPKPDIYLQDLATKKQTRVTTSGQAFNPKIYGDKIVWYDMRNYEERNSGSVYMYDIPSAKETYINLSDYSSVDIYKNRIVFGQNGTIYMYNISTSSTTQVTPHPWYWSDNEADLNNDANGNPVLYGDILACSIENTLGNYGLNMYNISAFTQRGLGSLDTYAGNPAIYGDTVVWEENRNYKNPDLYMLNVPTSTEYQLTFSRYKQANPDIYENKIVWQDSRNGKWDIYMGTISYSPIAAFSASPVSGKAPLKVQFTDKSTGTVTSWKWSFGDKTYSNQKNPKHTYSKPGKYTVSLTVKNAKGSNTKTISKYITVKSK
jgi:beta propeller repeat protein